VAMGAIIRVFYGVVNSITPSGMYFGDVPPYTLSPSFSSGVICLAVTVDSLGAAISAAIQQFSSMPTDAEPVFYLQLGSYSTSGGLSVTPGGAGNGVGDQSFVLCGGPGGTAEFGPA